MWRWRYFKSKQALVIIFWYMVLNICLESIPYTSVAFLRNALLVAIFFLYPFFGMIADIWCGRYLMITIGMCWTWGGAILVATYVANETAFSNIYLLTVLQSVQLAGIGIFQANALQFGTDQLMNLSSEQFSSFVHWYVWAQEISDDIHHWMKTAIDFITPAYSYLLELLLVAVLISLVLCFRFLPTCGWRFEYQMRANPYKLIFGVLRFAWRHKQPVNRSAFTFWEEKIPSRIELGKKKYGGPYSNENVEDVKTFFRIARLLLSLTAFFTCRNGFLLTRTVVKLSPQLTSRGIIDGLIFISLPLHELAIYPFAKSFYPGMIKRTLLGGIVTLFTVCMYLIFYAIGIFSNIGHREETIFEWLTIIPSFCESVGYLIFTMSLLEFIVAQSPQSMRGLLIGVYYCIAYGISQFIAWILYLPFRENGESIYKLIYFTIMAAVGILGLAIFARVSSTYKNRERDEVVNIHLFAESYFGSENVAIAGTD